MTAAIVVGVLSLLVVWFCVAPLLRSDADQIERASSVARTFPRRASSRSVARR